jgi:hypothetical protein
MKTKTALLLAATPALFAGTPETVPQAETREPWITPLVDIRTRYEFADVDGADPSHAWTFRERLGVKSTSWNGISALIEGEFSQAAVDDYHGAAPGADPFDPSNSAIPDPETNELNQAYLQYEGFDTTTRFGRQRIIHNNAAFIGNVGWRQNEQTYDAISLSNHSIDGLAFDYAYVNQVNRIFGSDADAPLNLSTNVQDIAASIHLFNAAHTGIAGVTLGGYAYLMNFENLGSWDNNTFGATAKKDLLGLAIHGELAWQDKAGPAGAEEALYAHINATHPLKAGDFEFGSLTLGVEHLDAGFKTPLATLHAFNGFADAFVGGRTNGSHNGLTDTYLAHSLPVFWGIKWMNVLHFMGDNELSAGYGWEYNSVLTKKFDDHFSAIAKFAHFESEGDTFAGATALPTTSRFSLEVNYVF